MRLLPAKIWSTMTAFPRQAHFLCDQNRTHITSAFVPSSSRFKRRVEPGAMLKDEGGCANKRPSSWERQAERQDVQVIAARV
jgi:hypothetical protein